MQVTKEDAKRLVKNNRLRVDAFLKLPREQQENILGFLVTCCGAMWQISDIMNHAIDKRYPKEHNDAILSSIMYNRVWRVLKEVHEIITKTPFHCWDETTIKGNKNGRNLY